MIFEFRQYNLHPGRRDALIGLFDRYLVEPQEDVGMHVVGQYRDIDNENRFVWLRAFADMSARRDALASFYGGPVWQLHRNAAVSTMIDSDDVLLLHGNLPIPAEPRPPAGSSPPGSVVTANGYFLDSPADEGFGDFFAQRIVPAVICAGATMLGTLTTAPFQNDFPALPVRNAGNVLVWFARFIDASHLVDYNARLGASSDWRDDVLPRLRSHYVAPPMCVRLTPTARSLLR